MKFTNINIGKRLGITFGTITLLAILLLLVSYTGLNQLSNRWQQFDTVSMEKYEAASKGKADLGDAIHMFKDYVLRGQDYDQKFTAAMAAIDQDAADYAAKHGSMSERENSALQQIKASADEYRAALKKAVELKTAGTTIEEIDKTIKGADKPLGKAFDDLLEVVKQEKEATTQSIYSTTASSERNTIAHRRSDGLAERVVCLDFDGEHHPPVERRGGSGQFGRKGRPVPPNRSKNER